MIYAKLRLCPLFSTVLGKASHNKKSRFSFWTYIVNVKIHFIWNGKSLKEMFSFCFMIAWYLGTVNSAVMFSDKGF